MRIVSEPLLLEPRPARKWCVARVFIVHSDVLDGALTVPDGFICDLSSIPRFLWWESTPADYPEAGVIHDYAYHDNHLPRAVADKLYREALDMLDAGGFRRQVRYWGLRAFGWHAYRNDAPKP